MSACIFYNNPLRTKHLSLNLNEMFNYIMLTIMPYCRHVITNLPN